jgi:hypothetical protein
MSMMLRVVYFTFQTQAIQGVCRRYAGYRRHTNAPKRFAHTEGPMLED